MKKRKYRKKRKHYEYSATAKICNSCHLRQQCTRSKTGRTLKRHARQDDLDLMLTLAISAESKEDFRTRQHLMERSFARATRYGYKRARWRRLWRVQIQEYLTASIQNIMVLLRHVKEPTAALAMQKRIKGTGRGHTGDLYGFQSNNINKIWSNFVLFSSRLKQCFTLAYA